MPATLTAPPPAPTKPASVPSPAPKPAGGSPPPIPGSSEHEPSVESYLGDIGDELGALDVADDMSAKPKAPQRGEDGKFRKPSEKPEEAHKPAQDKPEEEKAPETPPEPEKPVEESKPSNIRALGKAYDELKKERDQVYKPKLQSLEAKVKDYETKLEQLSKSQPDIKTWQEKMQSIEKENQALREVVRFADYKKSPEFTEKYQKPYEEAWAKAVSEVTQLSLQMEDGTVRKATPNDLLALANAPLDQLDDLAAQWFPKSSPRVIRHVEKIRDLAEQQDKALEAAKKGADEFQAKRADYEKQSNQEFVQAFTGADTEIKTKYPKWFGKDDTDPKGNQLLDDGFSYADSVFGPPNTPVKLKDGTVRPLTIRERASRLAVIRGKFANHDRLAYRLKMTEKERDDYKAKLKEYEASEPPEAGEAQPDNSPNLDWRDSVEAELRKLDR